MGNKEICGECLQSKNQTANQQLHHANKKHSLSKVHQALKNQSNSNNQDLKVTPQYLQVPLSPKLYIQTSKSDPLQEIPQKLPLYSIIRPNQKVSKLNIKQTTSYYPQEQKQTEPKKIQQLYNITEYGTESALNSNIKLPQNSKASMIYEQNQPKIR